MVDARGAVANVSHLGRGGKAAIEAKWQVNPKTLVRCDGQMEIIICCSYYALTCHIQC
jgi:hypothetical protein